MRDSNSRYGITAHTLSRRAPSTTRTTLHVLSKIKLFTSATLASLARFKESCQEKKKTAQRQILRVHIILDRRKNMREFVCLSSCAIILPFPYCTLHKFCIFPASSSVSYSCSCSSSCLRRLSSNASDISSRSLMISRL